MPKRTRKTYDKFRVNYPLDRASDSRTNLSRINPKITLSLPYPNKESQVTYPKNSNSRISSNLELILPKPTFGFTANLLDHDTSSSSGALDTNLPGSFLTLAWALGTLLILPSRPGSFLFSQARGSLSIQFS